MIGRLKEAAAGFSVLALASCGVVASVKETLREAAAIQADMAQSVGADPHVSLDWKDGSLTVTITFSQPYPDLPLDKIAAAVRSAVAKEIKQKPSELLMAFSVSP